MSSLQKRIEKANKLINKIESQIEECDDKNHRKVLVGRLDSAYRGLMADRFEYNAQRILLVVGAFAIAGLILVAITRGV